MSGSGADGGTGANDAAGAADAAPGPKRRVRKPKLPAEAKKTVVKSGPPLIALTGASGFLGAHIAAALAAAGARIRILSHRRAPHPLWRDIPVEIVTGSVTDSTACARLVAGADAVIHAAGLIKATRTAAFSEVNMQGTANLAEVVRDTGPACRLVLVSSLVVREPQLSPYAASKWAGELAAQAAFSRAPGRLIILRPPAIYGPWDREGLVLFNAAGAKFAPVFGKGRITVMHVQDVANAIAQVALGPVAAGSYALAGPGLAAYTMRELMEAAMQAVGGNPRLFEIPGTFLRAAGRLSGWRARLRDKADIFTVGKAREMLHSDWTVAASEVLPASVFQPTINLYEGFQGTVGWYKTAGWLSELPPGEAGSNQPPLRITQG